MHLSSRGFNARIMYAFLPNHEPVLLHAFYEKAGKKRTDYTGKVELALSRLEVMREELKNEQYRI